MEDASDKSELGEDSKFVDQSFGLMNEIMACANQLKLTPGRFSEILLQSYNKAT